MLAELSIDFRDQLKKVSFQCKYDIKKKGTLVEEKGFKKRKQIITIKEKRKKKKELIRFCYNKQETNAVFY